MGVLNGSLMMCSLYLVCASSTGDVLLSRKPFGVKMCQEMETKFAEKLNVRYKVDTLECIFEELPHTLIKMRKEMVLVSHDKQNISVPIGIRRGSKGKYRPSKEADVKSAQPSPRHKLPGRKADETKAQATPRHKLPRRKADVTKAQPTPRHKLENSEDEATKAQPLSRHKLENSKDEAMKAQPSHRHTLPISKDEATKAEPSPRQKLPRRKDDATKERPSQIQKLPRSKDEATKAELSPRHKLPRRKADLKKAQVSTRRNSHDSYEVLSIAGNVAHDKIFYVLLRTTNPKDTSCYIMNFKLTTERSIKSTKEKPFKIKCLVSEKRVHQIFKGSLDIDILGVVTSGDVMQLRLFGNPFQSNFMAFSAPLFRTKWNGPTFCFLCGDIVCIQRNSLFKVKFARVLSTTETKPHHLKLHAMTDVAYSHVDKILIIVCKEQLILAKMVSYDGNINVKDTIRTGVLTVTLVNNNLVFYVQGPPGAFKTCPDLKTCRLPYLE